MCIQLGIKRFWFLFLVLLFWGNGLVLLAQGKGDVTWRIRVVPEKRDYQVGEEVILEFEARIKKGFHVFSAIPSNGGYRETSFQLDEQEAKGIELVGTLTEEGKLEAHYDELMEDTLRSYKNKVVFRQRLKIVGREARIRGYLTYQYCTDDEGKCFFPTEEIDIRLKVSEKQSGQTDKVLLKEVGEKVDRQTSGGDEREIEREASAVNSKDSVTFSTKVSSGEGVEVNSVSQKVSASEIQGAKKSSSRHAHTSLWWLFFKAFLFGLAAIFTPCVFPIIPMTISFFTKMSSNKQEGLKNALIYAVSIFLIFVLGGLIVSSLIGATGMYKMASNPWVNLVFFVIIFLFGLSLLGLFDIKLPASWTTALDRQAERGGFLGIFFMALTLVLVSFSCTGPLVGTILIDAASGKILYPLVGMAGFGLAFALPFGLFAVFPTYLNTLPKSGGWLNTVKVTLGFLELALALKFLSNADLVWHTRILDREIYLTLWIVIFSMLGFYLLGKIRLPGDDPVETISVGRLLASMAVFSFVVYMIPGLWGAPLKMLSGFLPPVNPEMGVIVISSHQNQVTSANSSQELSGMSNEVCHLPRKYADKLAVHTPLGFCAFYDLQEARDYSQRVKKPILIDFTGHTCVNCRQVESNVWSHPEIQKLMQEHFVLVSLYVDEAERLSKPIRTSKGKTLRTVGDYWLYLQDSLFHTQAQPYYVIVDHELNVLGEPQAYTLSVEEYKDFLQKGIEEYRKFVKK